MQFQARLVLSDGLIYTGVSLGAAGETIGEVVFNTAMSGYQEILTDPSYHGQIVTMTYPQIGNYGVNSQDIESRKIFAAGFIIREYSPIVSHWQAQKSLDEYLKHNGIVGICEVDTRSLTRHLRDEGAQMGIISTLNSSDRELLEKVNKYPTLVGRDIVREVITDSPYELPVDKNTGSNSENTAYKVAVYDYGIKYSILRKLRSFGCKLKVFPANTLPEDIMLWKPDGLFLSNGPGDPEPLDYAIKSINALLGKIPVFGVCLGHQLLCLALNGKITKLKFGHHGANHPVKNMVDNSIEITSQNHGFVVDIDSLSSGDIEITHINLNDGTLEGFRHRSIPAFSVQYHPEAAPGPHDSHYLFEQFITYMKDFHA
ncbi:carbamoyl phosphate synthase small subunit [bacterium SM23_31]|nr:MAG: carbamoyl phosphate synthase small subunit [bacterium SM23_31]